MTWWGRAPGILRLVRAPFASAVEVIAPARLGRAFRWLLSASVITNVGDGVALAAGPLLVASQTRDPLLVSMALLAQTLPALLFGVVAGAVSDRYDRRRIVLAVDQPANAMVLIEKLGFDPDYAVID